MTFSFVVAFLLSNSFRARYPVWLIWGGAVSTLAALTVSGSRSAVGSVGLVFLLPLFCCSFLRRKLALKWVGSLIVVGAAMAVFMLSRSMSRPTFSMV